ncbi:PepSY-associated TM helix domain-containing protein [Paenibacillus solisilvae]|uniref:PepSY-associated TM helix domain-containing protein n=1 Tax=Paenibacillus solisilvae TaxID=2486751 RepID=A0ABW0VVB4_9BACL
MPEATLESQPSLVIKHEAQPKHGLFATIWRWHFYAGMIFMPFLILLAVTGGIYLFKDQIDDMRYHHLFHIEAKQTEKMDPSWQIEAVKKQYSGASVVSYTPSFKADQTAEVGIEGTSGSLSVYVNPYDGSIVGDLDKSKTIMELIRDLHGSLLVGDKSIGDKIVEVSACWAIVLLITGLYLWWPRGRDKVFGTWLPRLRQGKKILIRDLHAVPLFWMSIVLLVLVISGLPWSGITGDYINRAATASQTGYPDFMWNAPPSEPTTKDIMDVPWAAEHLPVPKSNSNGAPTLPVENIIQTAEKEKVHPGYSIAIPSDEKGVYTVSVWPKAPKDEATLHIDQYSGKVLTNLRYADYGPSAKAIEIGIALHEGHFFGTANLLLCLLACISLAGTAVLGAVMWWRRRPKGQSRVGAPNKPTNYRLQKGVAIIVIILAILLPLVGITFLAALIIDCFILRQMPKVKVWMN